MNLRCDENFTYIDEQVEKVETRFNSIYTELGKEIDSKLESIRKDMPTMLTSVVQENIKLVGIDSKITSLVDAKMNKHEAEINNRLEEADKKIADMIRLNTTLQDDLKQKIEELKSFNVVGDNGDKSLRRDINRLISQANDNTAWLEGLQNSHDTTARSLEQLDQLTRRNRVIKDQLDDEEKEETKTKIDKILDHTLSAPERSATKILQAYRLGNKFVPKRSRKILVEFSKPQGRDIVLQNHENQEGWQQWKTLLYKRRYSGVIEEMEGGHFQIC